MNKRLSEQFLDLLTDSLDSLRRRLYAINLNERPIRDDYKSIDSLVDGLYLLGKSLPNKCTIRDHQNLEFYFFKRIIEKNAPLFYCEEKIFNFLKIRRDRSKISGPIKNKTAVQIAAYILKTWRGESVVNIQDMLKQLQDPNQPFLMLLALKRFHRSRTIEDWIRPVFSIFNNESKGKPSQNNEIKSIFGIDPEKGVNFQKLRFSILCVVKILQELGWHVIEIFDSKFIKEIQDFFTVDLQVLIQEWILESFSIKCIF